MLHAAFVLLSLSTLAHAEDFPGGPGITPDEMGELPKAGARPPEAPKQAAEANDEMARGFGEDTGMTSTDRDLLEKNRLDFGGSLWSELNYFQFWTDPTTSAAIMNPNTLWLYLDGRLKNDVRAFIKFRAIYDPTADPSIISPFTGRAGQELTTLLDELKLQFQIKKTVFFTVGKQKLRWGTGKFWNPTDVVNNQRFDFRFGQDIRTGIPMLKVHVPIKAMNFYWIELMEDVSQPLKLQHAFRAEIPFWTAEVSPGILFGGQKDPTLTLDASAGIWDFDLYGEVAYSPGTRQTFYNTAGAYQDLTRWWVSTTGGISYDVKYSDSDVITFNVEAFYNGLGYTSTLDYLPVLYGGGYQPFYLGQVYGMFVVYLPAPGNWEKVNFSLFNLANLTDLSAMSRFDVTTTILEGLSVTFAVGVHYGRNDGELRLGGQLVDTTVRLMANF